MLHHRGFIMENVTEAIPLSGERMRHLLSTFFFFLKTFPLPFPGFRLGYLIKERSGEDKYK